MKKRLFFVLLTLVSVLALASCSKKYTVTFNSDGGSQVAAQEVKKGASVTKPEDPTKEGYTFNRWELNGKKYVFGSAVTSNIELVASWKVMKLTVAFSTNGGNKISSQNVEFGKTTTKPTDPIRDGYVFKGWQLDGKDYDFQTPVKSQITLVANWEEETGVSFVKVTYELDGGALPAGTEATAKVKKDTPLVTPTPTKTGFTFAGWTLNGVKFASGTVVSEDITLVANWTQGSGPTTYQPRWTPNQRTNGWRGPGEMEINILVLPASEYDPFNADYNGSAKSIMQRQQRLVEGAYGVLINYVEWTDAWGPERVAAIKTNTASGDYEDNNVFIVNIASSWIPTLAKASCLAELYNTQSDSGIFTEVGYEETFEDSGVYVPGTYHQDATINEVMSVNGKVYGYNEGLSHPDYFMYYNAQLIKDCGLDDPAEMWFRGEWTWGNFEKYCADLQNSLNPGQYALSLGYAEFVIGSVASTGSKIASSAPTINITGMTMTNRFTAIQKLYQSGCYAKHGVAVVDTKFTEGNVAIVHGDLWFINDPTRFDPAVCTFPIGAVPYPTADNQGGTPITTTNADEAVRASDGTSPLTLSKTQTDIYIKGVDMSESSFKVPYTSASCYSIINTPSGKNGINNKIIFAIMYDLYSGLGQDPNQVKVDTATAYRNSLKRKFDNELYVDALMSVDDCTYFELMELLSMTVGGGSHFGPNAFWPLASGIVEGNKDAYTELKAVESYYYDEMNGMGYPVGEPQ